MPVPSNLDPTGNEETIVVKKDSLTFKAEESGSTIKLTVDEGNPTVSGLQYRRSENSSWSPYTIDEVLTLTNVGDIIQFRNVNNQLSSDWDIVKFEMTGKISAHGNIYSLLNYPDRLDDIYMTHYGCFHRLFRDCISLLNCPELWSPTLANNCYKEICAGCTGLLNARSIAYGKPIELKSHCLEDAFKDCTSLRSGIDLRIRSFENATYCCKSIYEGCTNLVYPGMILNTIDFSQNALDRAFRNCSSLKYGVSTTGLTPSSYNYQTLQAGAMYATYAGCTSLTGDVTYLIPRQLRSVNNEALYATFSGCTGITKAVLDMSDASGANGMAYMFYNCSSLSELEVSFTSWPYGLTDWVANVASSGTFIKPSSLSADYGNDKIPTGWTYQDK